MNRQLKTILFLVSVLGFASAAGADDRWETLRAINWVENPTNHTRMGRFGELGPYQFRSSTWKMHTKRPFSQATHREAADEVAVKHYEWIKRTLAEAGVDANAYNIAMAWNCGVNNVLKGRVPAVSYDYASRVTNLVQSIKQQSATRVAAGTSAAAPLPDKIHAPVLSLDAPLVSFALAHPTAPTFELVLPPEPEEPIVYTDRSPAPEEPGHRFTFTTTATLTPRFSL
jgi:hypothetical protein